MEKENIFNNRYMVPVLAILACLLWGSAIPSLKVSFEYLAIAEANTYLKILFAAYRFLLASLMLFAWILVSRNKSYRVNRSKSPGVKIKDLGFLFTLGLLQTSFQYLFFYIGLSNTTGVKGSIFTTLGIFLTVIVSHFIYRDDRLNFAKVFGLITGILGVIIINLSRGSLSPGFSLNGEGLLVLTAVTSTLAAILVKSRSHHLAPLLVTAYQMLFGSLVLFLVAVTRVHPASLKFTSGTLLLLVYLAFISAGGFGIWYSLIRYNRLGYISIYKFIIPVTGVLLSALFLSEESISLNVVLSLFLVSSGVILINIQKARDRARRTLP